MHHAVKRRKQEDDIAGALELEGVGKDDPALSSGLRNIGRATAASSALGTGLQGVRIIFSRQADLDYWRQHYAKGSMVRAAFVWTCHHGNRNKTMRRGLRRFAD